MWKQWWFWLVLALGALLVGGGLAALVGRGGGDGTTTATTALPATSVATTVATTLAPTTAAPTTTVPRTTTTTEPPTTTEAPTTTTAAPVDLGIGDTAQLAGGAVARVDSVTKDAPPLNDAFPPAAGTSLTRLEVEECAGPSRLLSNPVLWAATLDDGTSVQPVLGNGGYQTVGLAPGACQRGLLEVEVPTGRLVAAVVRSDDLLQEVARWQATRGAPPSGQLTSGTTPASSPLGKKITTPDGDVTALTVTPGAPPRDPVFSPPAGSSFTRVGVELCATGAPLVVNPFYWLAQLGDSTLVQADIVASDLPPGELAPGQCAQGTFDVVVPDGRQVAAVVYLDPQLTEVARWSS